MPRRCEKGGIDAIVEPTIKRWSSAGLAERNPAVIARIGEMIRHTSSNGYRGCAAALARLNYGHRLGEIGGSDAGDLRQRGSRRPAGKYRQMHAMIKGSHFLEIKQAGHISNIEHPDIFNEAVGRLLDDVERGATRAAE